MKNFKFIISILSLILTSCASTSYYFQVYKATPSEKIINQNGFLVYEDDNCKVYYNLWEENGNIGFKFLNKIDKNIYLNLEESFFILNGIAYDYYKNRIFTHSSGSGTTNSKISTSSTSVTGINYFDLIQTNKINATNSVGFMNSSGYSVSYNEEKTTCIPPQTSKIIDEYRINESLYRDCDLFKYPNKKQLKSKTFTKQESPLVFSNIISYSIGHEDSLIKVENEFYVTEISNFPESEIIISRNDEYCGQKSLYKNKYFKNVSADKFYVKYTKGEDSWDH